jgi:hypothetical protein
MAKPTRDLRKKEPEPKDEPELELEPEEAEEVEEEEEDDDPESQGEDPDEVAEEDEEPQTYVVLDEGVIIGGESCDAGGEVQLTPTEARRLTDGGIRLSTKEDFEKTTADPPQGSL